jgi:Nickel responsive protein SCO4226-like
MPRYVVERTYDVDQDELPSVGRRSKQIAGEHFPEIVWEHSHVVMDSEGVLKSFCIYEAPDEDTIRRHSVLLGCHVVDHIYEIGGDVTPDDFPLSPEGTGSVVRS